MASPNDALIRALPKAELHLHIEGSLEPELLFDLAKKGGVQLPYPDVAAVRAAYNFTNLQTFLDIYYAGAAVLRTRDDFYELTMQYLKKAHAERIVHTEIFFDPQTHTERGVSFETAFRGIRTALDDAAKDLGISSRLIMCFLRHLPEEACFATLAEAEPFISHGIDGVGLDSSEVGNPPDKFTRLFARCKALGLKRVAHAGEEGPAQYVRDALDHLDVSRIDHGVRSIEDPELVARLAAGRVPLTVCPFSNVKLKVFQKLEDHNLRALLAAGLCATVNSDDPAYFGGYLQDNFLGCDRALQLPRSEVLQLARNAFEASWLSDEDKAKWFAEIDAVAAQHP